MSGRVLVVDDDASVGTVLVGLLEQAGYSAQSVLNAHDAMAQVELESIDVVISDIRMPGMSGMQLLTELRRAHPDVPVVMLTAHGTVPLAVEAMREGAADFLLKPFDREEVLHAIGKAMALAEHDPRPPAPDDGYRLLGESAAIVALRDQLERTAPTNATVLLSGETGTGKELAARTLHRLSKRANGALISVNCAALPENLLESELFGYVRGAFTGAVANKPGRVELAEGGTLFLDEIAEMSPRLQAKVLRLLQEREYQPVGASATRSADVRFVAATHRDLEVEVTEGRFREDLYFRLSVVPLTVPSLRDRRSDISILARAFFVRACESHGREEWRLDESALDRLSSFDWPGNIRELRNAIERVVILADGPLVDANVVESLLEQRTSRVSGTDLRARLRETERSALVEALEATENRTQTAKVLGISRRTLYNKLEEHGLI